MTVANFVALAEGPPTARPAARACRSFDGTVFTASSPGTSSRAGIPLAGSVDRIHDSNGIVPGLGHGRAGMLGMASSGPHTGTNQFYITLGDRSYLDGNYTVFGEVYSGLDHVTSIVQGDWIDHVRIVRAGEKASAFKSDAATVRAAVDAAKAKVRAADEKKARDEAALIKKTWPGARPSPKAVVVTRKGSARLPRRAAFARRYTARQLDGRQMASSQTRAACSAPPPRRSTPVEGRA
jgi:cyclophilin family peptidyl-prolyl cis-trans isomerase